MGPCHFGLARAGAGSGTATVVVTRHDGRTRSISFERLQPVGAETNHADGYGALRTQEGPDPYIIRAGDARDEIPEAVVTGG